IVAGRYEMFLGHLRDWQSMGGDNLLGMLDFFRCSHHTELPLIDIWSHLAAWRIVGTETFSPSDVMDIHHISAFMPYCTHMVLDKSMINAVQSLGLDAKYGTRVMRLRDVPSLLDSDA
uniref:hypothetical protein n=1 Tax=Gemmatimonas sp. TaxID=1962908 RepID=UPI003568D3EB